MATARPPPPLLPGLLGGNKAQGLKKRGANRNQRTVPEVAKAVLRYMKGRRTEIVEMEMGETNLKMMGGDSGFRWRFV